MAGNMVWPAGSAGNYLLCVDILILRSSFYLVKEEFFWADLAEAAEAAAVAAVFLGGCAAAAAFPAGAAADAAGAAVDFPAADLVARPAPMATVGRFSSIPTAIMEAVRPGTVGDGAAVPSLSQLSFW